MKPDEIIEAARKAGLVFNEEYGTDTARSLHLGRVQAFAELIAAAEREACAKVCDARAIEYDGYTEEQNASEELATAIRARGQA